MSDPRQACRKEYGARREVLLAMGFMNYQEYLASALWASIRRRVLAKNAACVACGGPATQVHHGRYTRPVMEGRELRHLYSVCDDCHRHSEYTRKGQKLNPSRATDKLLETARHRKRLTREANRISALSEEEVRIENQRKNDDRASAEATLANYLKRAKMGKGLRKKHRKRKGR